MQGNQKVEVNEFVGDHEIDLLISTVGISRDHMGIWRTLTFPASLATNAVIEF